ncbi:hypothetical protein [Micromonospora sp. RTP1Z1]|uniref:hypothetical protein n=1 Tax=Micromonospora sp. RTP1Z1 TaxID=2994043 RepID=UPI0029C8DF3C|nr:hypothetical protein [Micromonospora sp. RTP1Z1]
MPWFRRGAATDITTDDDPTATATGRAVLPVALALSYVPVGGGTARVLPAVTRSVELVGPGDVAGLRRESVLRVHPPDGATGAAPGELAFVEFYDEDLPWRVTPAKAAQATVGGVAVTRLRPWLALLVVADGEFRLTAPAGRLPVLTVADGMPLPPVLDGWAWAHAQVAGAEPDAGKVGPRADTDPDTALSRLLSPRRLVAGVTYSGFLVPAFETGRLAGLGLDPAGVPTQQASWGAGQADRRLPVYYSWRFTVGADVSFETLARGLTGRPAAEHLGKRAVDVHLPGYGLDEVPIASPPELEGALRPPNFTRAAYPDGPGTDLVDALEHLVDLGSDLLDPATEVPLDPIVAPPAYGRLHAGVVRVADVADGDEAGWVRELNLDLRNRAAAGLGAQVVRDRQEELVARAWQQVGALRDANQRLREAELATAAGQSVYAKHLAGLDADGALLFTAAAHRGLPGTTTTVAADADAAGTVHAAVVGSRVPSAVQDLAFRRVTRPGRPFVRAATGTRQVGSLRTGLIAGMDADPAHAVSAARPLPAPAAAVPLAAVTALAATAAAGLKQHATDPKRVYLTLAAADLAARLTSGGVLTVPPQADFQAALRTALTAWSAQHPAATATTTAVTTLIGQTQKVEADGPGAKVTITAAAFTAAFGAGLAGKSYRAVTAVPDVVPAGGTAARMTDTDDAQATEDDVGQLGKDLAERLSAAPAPPPPLGGPQALAGAVLAALDPAAAVSVRVGDQLPGLAARLTAQAATRVRRLRPVQAYPTFPDPMVDALAALAADHVLPNLGDLPAETLTVMEPNQRFIESFLAGLNTELGRELLWREYPTDQRGSCARVFWDRADAADPGAPDIQQITDWTAALGGNGISSGTPVVLVVRSALLRLYPNTLVYALPAVWNGAPADGRRLPDAAAAARRPVFHATLDPDVALYGFDLTQQQARGHIPTGTSDPLPADPGWFFVLQERPGQPRFGLDTDRHPAGLRTWDDLSWPDLTGADTYLDIAANSGLAPQQPDPALWGTTSADMAAILMRSPVMYARHADDLLPAGS